MRYSTSVAFDFDPNHLPISCAAVVFPEIMGARGCTPWSYLALNRELAVGNTSLVETPGSIVKRSWVGKALVETGCKLIDSVVMDGAVLGQNVKLEGCIVGSDAKIGKGCHLIGCDVGNKVSVPEGTSAKGECFDV